MPDGGEERSIGLPGIAETTRTHLILSPDATFDEWLAAGNTLLTLHWANNWLIGDLLVQGEERFGDLIAQLADWRSADTIGDWAWVARKIPAERRRESVPWSLHRDVIAFPPNEQERLLGMAESGEWTRAQMLRHLKTLRGNAEKPEQPQWSAPEPNSAAIKVQLDGNDESEQLQRLGPQLLKRDDKPQTEEIAQELGILLSTLPGRIAERVKTLLTERRKWWRVIAAAKRSVKLGAVTPELTQAIADLENPA